MRTARMHLFRAGKDVDAPVIDDLASLVWAANLSAIELHPYLSQANAQQRPNFVVFDLDPGEPADVLDACRVALRMRDLLDGLGLATFPKTSGAKGLHVYVPLSGEDTHAETKAFARTLALWVARGDPQRVVHRMARRLRQGRVLIDWSQNDPGKSTVAPYSVRALELPTVSTPLAWNEIDAALAAADWRRLVFGPGEVLDRVRDQGDLFAGVLARQQTLPALHRDAGGGLQSAVGITNPCGAPQPPRQTEARNSSASPPRRAVS